MLNYVKLIFAYVQNSTQNFNKDEFLIQM